MANFNTTITAKQRVPCSNEDYLALSNALRSEDEDDCSAHGFSVEFDTINQSLFVFAEDTGEEDMLPFAFLELLGKLITKAGMEHLEFGVAFTCDKIRPNSHGGKYFWILPSGEIAQAKMLDYKQVANLDLMSKNFITKTEPV